MHIPYPCQPVAPGSKCDPTLQGRVEARVVMYSLLPKLAHQQSWTFDNDTGHFALKTDTSLCVAVEPGCPHSSSGCLQLQKCDGSKVSLLYFVNVKLTIYDDLLCVCLPDNL